jgi:predicted GH43/DUF377 family glycosyl hydrolase
MLFRATGPWPEARIAGKPLPYPIFLGYAYSDDNGHSWQADFSRPAFKPALTDEVDRMYVTNIDNEKVVNYANGGIEDARLFRLQEQTYMTVACRMFPPGPYWVVDDPMQCAPDWAKHNDQPFGRAAGENVTVSVLFQVDLAMLAAGRYEEAFGYVTHLTDPQLGENRDVFLFPEQMDVQGKKKHVCIHRPVEPRLYGVRTTSDAPSIFVTAADRLEDFATGRAVHSVLAEPIFDWEGNRIGGSWPPLRIQQNEWLFAYHGKKDDRTGYTQSFMILKQQPGYLPVVSHRCPERLMYARHQWELPSRFPIPCLFATGGIVVGGQLIISYGAADEKIGIAWTNFDRLVSYIRRFDAGGRPTAS